jgi:hypothetical protein
MSGAKQCDDRPYSEAVYSWSQPICLVSGDHVREVMRKHMPAHVGPEPKHNRLAVHYPDKIGARDHAQVRQGLGADRGSEFLTAFFGLRESLGRRGNAKHRIALDNGAPEQSMR